MEETTDHRIRLKPSFFISIAASIGLLVILYHIFFGLTTVYAPKGQHIVHFLPDSSQVWLNADSEIRYKNFSRESEREVELRGEAFFRVVKGGSFELQGNYGTVTVLGTSFNVNQRKGLDVSCFRGTVLVTNKAGKSAKLHYGQSSMSKDTVLTIRKFNSEREASWLTGDFYFKNTPLEEVLEEVQRQFDVEIQYEEEIPRTYTGYFNNRDLDDALQSIFSNMSMHFRKEGTQIIVDHKAN